MAQPGWSWLLESSVSSACADIPLAKAAMTGVVVTFEPRMRHCSLPPRSRACCRPSLPGLRVDPDTIAASVSNKWLLPFWITSGGNAARRAASIYSTSESMILAMKPLREMGSEYGVFEDWNGERQHSNIPLLHHSSPLIPCPASLSTPRA